MLDSTFDTVFAVTRFSFPPQRGLVQKNESMQYWQPANANARSQDLEPIFHDAGQFYYCKVPELKERQTLLGKMTCGYEVPELEAQDIDNTSDWQIAEYKYKRMVSSHGRND